MNSPTRISYEQVPEVAYHITNTEDKYNRLLDFPRDPLDAGHQFMHAVVRLGFKTQWKPYRHNAVEVVPRDHLESHKVLELHNQLFTAHPLTNVLNKALDYPQVLYFPKRQLGLLKRELNNDRLDPLMDTMAARMTMTAYERAATYTPDPHDIKATPQGAWAPPSEQDQALADEVYEILQGNGVKAYGAAEINDLVLDGLHGIIAESQELSPYWEPGNAQDIATLATVNPYFISCTPCQEIAGIPVAEINALRISHQDRSD